MRAGLPPRLRGLQVWRAKGAQQEHGAMIPGEVEFFSYAIAVPWYVAAGALLAFVVLVVALARKTNGRW